MRNYHPAKGPPILDAKLPPGSSPLAKTRDVPSNKYGLEAHCVATRLKKTAPYRASERFTSSRWTGA